MKCEQCQAEPGIKLVAKLKTAWDDPREQTYDEWLRCEHCGATYYAELTDYFFSDDFRIETYTADPQAWQESYARARLPTSRRSSMPVPCPHPRPARLRQADQKRVRPLQRLITKDLLMCAAAG